MVNQILRWRPSKEFVPRIQTLKGTFKFSRSEKNFRYFFIAGALFTAVVAGKGIYQCHLCTPEKLYFYYALVFALVCVVFLGLSNLRYQVIFSEGSVAVHKFGGRKSWEENLSDLVDVKWYEREGVRYMDLHWADRKRTLVMPDELWNRLVEKDWVRPADWGKRGN